MKATEQHINRSRQARQSSYHYRISKAVAMVAKVILIVIGAIVGLTIGEVIKKIFRGIGWIISILSALTLLLKINELVTNKIRKNKVDVYYVQDIKLVRVQLIRRGTIHW